MALPAVAGRIQIAVLCGILTIAHAPLAPLNPRSAAKIGGMDRQTLRDWVHRFNEEGPEGLIDRKGPARRRRLTETQMQELAELVETGPDLDTDGVVRWRRVDLQQVIEDRYGVTYNERTISKLLVAMGFSHMSARPIHPAQSAKVMDAFKKTSPTRSKHT